MLKYELEYDKYTRENFVKYVSKKYKIKKDSADRIWRKYRNIKAKDAAKERFKKSRIRNESDSVSFKTNKKQNDYMNKVFTELDTVKSEYKTESYKPSVFKLLTLTDMKRFNVTLNTNVLRRYGFSFEEIEWLKENKHI